MGGVGQGEGEPGDRAGRRGGPRCRASTCSRSRSASTSWPPSWARSWSCRASSRAAAARSRSRRSSTRTCGAWARRACATSSARFREALKRADRDRAPTTRERPFDRPDPRGPPLPLLARARGARVERGHHLLHGRVGQHGRRSRRRSCASRPSGSTPGCAASTGASTTSTWCTRRSPRRWTSTPSTTCARAGGTRISTAYELIDQILETRFPADAWNVYLFHFSDGENGDSRDTDACLELLRQRAPAASSTCSASARSARPTAAAASRPTSTRRFPAARTWSPARSATGTRSTTRSSASWGKGL